MGAFSDHAEEMRALGLAPTPTGKKGGKVPYLKGYNTRRLGANAIRQIASKFPDANLGLVTGLSGLAVVDVDDPELLEAMLQRFGDTPLIIKTASRGGFQLYYRAVSNIAAKDLRHSEDIAVEIKANSSLVIAPPSVNPDTGRCYEYFKGRLDTETLARLPKINAGGLPPEKTVAKSVLKSTVSAGAPLMRGNRNNELFRICLRKARAVPSFAELLAFARGQNASAQPPLEDQEVVKTCKSAWRYQSEGRNLSHSGGYVVVTKERIDRFCDDAGNPIALALRLELEHAARVQRGETFAISRRAMAARGTLPGWTEKNIRTATERAVKLGLIVKVESRTGGPTQYTLPGPRRAR